MYEYELRSKHPKWQSLLAAEYVVVQGYSNDPDAAAKLLNDLREDIDNDIYMQLQNII